MCEASKATSRVTGRSTHPQKNGFRMAPVQPFFPQSTYVDGLSPFPLYCYDWRPGLPAA
jgi:hypothetical protein